MAVNIRSVLVSDAVDPLCVDLLKGHGIDVVCKFKLPKDELIRELQEHDGLIVRSDTKVTKDVINSSPGLKVIGRAGTGVDNIDLEAATKKGVTVLNTPGGNSISACEMTCALITSLARNIVPACQSLKEGRWDRKLYTGNELYGKTLAILGLGRIGREVALRMASYGMRTVGFDPMVTAEDAKSFGVEKMELDEIWPLADYITVHTPLIPQTRNLVNDKTLGKCKKGVCIVNVARGGIVDEEALLRALKDGKCGGAALDVFEEEPPKNEVTLNLIKHPLVVTTPHLGASTYEAQQRVAVEIAEQFIALSGKNKPNENYVVNGAVNAPVLSAAMVETNTPWINLAEKLGRLLGCLSKKVASGSVVQLTAIVCIIALCNIVNTNEIDKCLLLRPSDEPDERDINAVVAVYDVVTFIVSGKQLENMKFLNVPLLSGMLATQTKVGLNLVNALTFAKEAGFSTEFKTRPGDPSLEVSFGSYTVLGTVGANKSAVVTSINGNELLPSGVAIGNNICVFESGQDKLDLSQIVGRIQGNGGQILSMAVASGMSKCFVLVQTAEELSPVNVANLSLG
ncbi:hypothetical protein RUM44_001685 [Polyplax serrata]|uniref:D-3-phosphoglycerate dehydrogenase n=1 Tax=Polyplax serrata TaxID=468196 RepID=A0ABR1AKR9_POLSC